MFFEEAVAGREPMRLSCFVWKYTAGVYGRTSSLSEVDGVVASFRCFRRSGRQAESKLFARRAQGARALHDDEAEATKVEAVSGASEVRQ